MKNPDIVRMILKLREIYGSFEKAADAIGVKRSTFSLHVRNPNQGMRKTIYDKIVAAYGRHVRETGSIIPTAEPTERKILWNPPFAEGK